MKDRIAIPIHNADGQLVAYAGRWVGGELPEGEEKYKLPPRFKKSASTASVRYSLSERGMMTVGLGIDALFLIHTFTP
jgi:hypothetical protein